MAFLAVVGFILLNIIGIVLLPRFAVCVYIWYVLAQWGYLSKEAPDWMVMPILILFFVSIGVFIWDVLRDLNFFSDNPKIF